MNVMLTLFCAIHLHQPIVSTLMVITGAIARQAINPPWTPIHVKVYKQFIPCYHVGPHNNIHALHKNVNMITKPT